MIKTLVFYTKNHITPCIATKYMNIIFANILDEPLTVSEVKESMEYIEETLSHKTKNSIQK